MTPKHILFVERDLRVDKLGFMYLSAMLKRAGHRVALAMGADDIDFCLEQHHIDFVMYSAVSGPHRFYLEKNRELKRKYKFVAVMGGPHFTFMPEDGLDDPAVDLVVRGPAENIIVPLVEGRIGGPLIMGQIPDLDTLPFPDRSILYDRYPRFARSPVKRFIAARDCPHACSYCHNHLFRRIFRDQKDRFLQITSPERIAAEICDVQDRWGLETAYLNDDDIARDRGWLTEFCHRFSYLDLEWCSYARADSLTPEIVRLAARSGCTHLIIGLESANLETRRLLRRTGGTNEDVRKAVEWCHRFGIKVRIANMIGLPVDDPLEDAMETLAFNLEIGPCDSAAAIFQPFPRTDAWKLCLAKGLIDEDTQCNPYFEGTPLDIPDREKINRLQHWWYFAVTRQMPTKVVRQLLDLPLTADQGKAMLEQRWQELAKTFYGIEA